ncbi:PD-(D/E)XK nuclease-like domain-containing protein [Providencia rettgeri]
MKYFKVTFVSQRSLHPEGHLVFETFIAAETKKEAKVFALDWLKENHAENCMYFKSPRLEDSDEQKYLASLKPVDEVIKKASEIDIYCALLVIFGIQDEFDEGEINDATDLLNTPDDEPEIYEKYLELRHDLDDVLAVNQPNLSMEAIKKLAVETFELGKPSTEPVNIPVKNEGVCLDAADEHETSVRLVNNSPLNDDRTPEFEHVGAVNDAEPLAKVNTDLLGAFPPVNGKILNGKGMEITMLNDCLTTLKPNESLIVRWLENETYHAADGYSSTQIRLVHNDGLSALDWYKNAPRKEQKEGSLSFGTAVHTAILEPHNFAKEYVCAPEVDLRTKDGKQELADFEERAKTDGLTVLKKDDFEMVELMRDSTLAYPLIADLLQTGEPELSIFYRTEGGLLLKIRPDWLGLFAGVPFILDVKTTDDVLDFGKSVDKFGYHMQAAYYRIVASYVFGLDIDFAFCAISKRLECGRYPVRLGLLDDEDAHEGVLQVQQVLEALETGDNSIPFTIFSRPWWAKQRDRKNREALDTFGGVL